MVRLSDPDPNPPISGHTLRITAYDGSPFYHFKWEVDDQGENIVHLFGDTLMINVPAGAEGEIIKITVRDGNQEVDRKTWPIAAVMVR